MIELTPCIWAEKMPSVVAFTLGRGGEAGTADPYAGDTICDYTGAPPAHIAANRIALAEALHIAPHRIVTARQTHSSEVRFVDGETSLDSLIGVDALVTDEPRLAIGINTADCVPILLADPQHGIVAAVHAGWRGTAARIVRRAVEEMTLRGASPATIQAHIGAAIGIDSYEVGDEVVEALSGNGIAAEQFARRYPSGRWHVDLKCHNALQLAACGIGTDRVTTDPRDTFSDPSLYSARRQGIASGRNFTGILLRRSLF